MPTLTDYWNFGTQRGEPLTSATSTIRHGFEAASQTFKFGDIVIVSSGKIAIGAASGSNIGANAIVAGRADMDATGTTNADMYFAPANAVTTFLYPVYHATPASAVTAYAQIGVSYEMINHATLGWAVDVASTTNVVCKVVDIDNSYPVGTSYGGLWIIFLAASRLHQ